MQIRHAYAERGRDCYATPLCAARALIAAEGAALPSRVWEPCAGTGGIATALRAGGYAVICSDIAEQGFPLHFVADFFATKEAPVATSGIVSNPPYRWANKFVEHALALSPYVALLLRLAFLESVRRSAILEGAGLCRVHVFKRRLPFMHRANWTGPRASSAIPFAWFVWSRGHRGPAAIDRIDWER
jgi:hypothetical protein